MNPNEVLLNAGSSSRASRLVKTRCVFVLLFSAAVAIRAQENRWSNSRGGGKWENGANWSLATPPNINHQVVIASAVSTTVTIDASSAALANNMVVSSLRVGRGDPSRLETDTLSLANAGSLRPLTVLGSAVVSNRGNITISGSVLDVGRDFTLSGRVQLNGGATLNVKDGLILAGGTCSVTPNSVLNVKGNNYPAYDFGVDGRITLNGGLVTFSNFFASGMAIGHLGIGGLEVFGGELQVAGSAFLHVGGRAGSTGSLTIAGGRARAEGQSLTIGGDAGATGLVFVASGELITKDTFIGGSLGRGGLGQLIVSNGVWRGIPDNSVRITPLGIVTLAGGTSSVARSLFVDHGTNGPGRLHLAGGTFLTTNTQVGVAGFLGVSNGVWRAQEVSVGNGLQQLFGVGRMVVAGGTTTIASSLVLGTCIGFAGTGLVTVAGGSLLVTNAATNATLRIENGVFRIEGGTVVVDTIDLTRPCGRLEWIGGVLAYRTALLDPARDDDGDGASNGLELSHGSDPLDPADGRRDSDGDGAVDAVELLAGTDRFDRESVVRIISILPQGPDLRLRWKTVGGKTNIIQAAANLDGVDSFEDLATVVIPGTGNRTNTFIEPDGANNGASRLYRVKVIP